MKQKATVQGRSMVFNILFVVLNIIGLAAVVIGSQKAFKDYFMLFNFIGYVLIGVSAAGLFVFRGRLMMANIARGFVGALFIVSGLVKANDPIGFAYKLEEYFEDGALAYRIKELFGAPGFSLEWLIPYALGLSVAICIVEILLGILLIIGGKIKWVAHLSLLMMLFFTFLTWHTASCDGHKKFKDHDTYVASSEMGMAKIAEAKLNKKVKIVSKTSTEIVVEEWKTPQCVTDCGCFGDAMKGSVGRSLTPLESLWKDIVLLYLVVWIFLAQWLIEPNTKTQNVKYLLSSVVLLSLLSVLFNWYFLVGFGMFLIIAALWILRAGGYFLGNYFGSFSIVTIAGIAMVSYVLMYEPLKDYRPFAEGKNLEWQMHDGFAGKFEYTHQLRNKRTGELETYTEKEYANNSDLWDDKQYVYVKMKTEEIEPSRLPTINDQFNPYLNRKDLTEVELKLEMVKKIIEKGPENSEVNLRKAIVKEKRIVLVTARNLNDANWKNIAEIKSIYASCKKDDIPFLVLTSSSRAKINAFKTKNNFDVPVFMNDETGLKAIARSNPSMMVIEKGIVKGKFPHRSIPSYEWLKKNTFKK
jgi:uncharacterized membrane protein YphA (DoxX/SURF4 family)